MNRILSIPGHHPYVDRCLPPGTSAADSPASIPSPAWNSNWLLAHRNQVDLVHLHFGFEQLGVAELENWLQTLELLGLPLVYTLHDLRNPHLENNSHHSQQLTRLIRAAAAVLTLTAGAAAEIEQRWGRAAQVVAHPFVVAPDQRPPRQSPGRRVGIHLKDLRRNAVEPGRIVRSVADAARCSNGRLQVDVHPGVIDRPELATVRQLGESGLIDLRVHPRFTDQELAAYLASLDVCVLPYRFGTHSGWLEACRDVGTRVVAPSCGYFRDQWEDVIQYRSGERAGLDDDDLFAAVTEALEAGAVPTASKEFRLGQLAAVHAHHRALYASLITPALPLAPAALEPVA